MHLVNCKTSLQLKWSKDCILVAGTTGNQNPKFEITDRKLYILVVALSTQDNIKLLKQPESGFQIIINWNKYLSKTTNQARNKCFGFLIDTSFEGVNILFLFRHLKMKVVEKVMDNIIFQL